APWGSLHTMVMRDSGMRERMCGFCMQGEDMPQPSNRVDLDPAVRDVRGFPVARVTYSPHRFEQAASAYYAAILERALMAVASEGQVGGEAGPHHVALGQQAAAVGRRHGPEEVVALPLLAAQPPQGEELGVVLDALGHGLHPEALAEADDRRHQLGVVRRA